MCADRARAEHAGTRPGGKVPALPVKDVLMFYIQTYDGFWDWLCHLLGTC